MKLTSNNKLVILYGTIFKVPSWVTQINILPSGLVKGTNGKRSCLLDIQSHYKPSYTSITIDVSEPQEELPYLYGYLLGSDNSEVLKLFPNLTLSLLKHLKEHTDICKRASMAVEQLEDLLKQRDPTLRAYHQGYLDRDRELSYNPPNVKPLFPKKSG